MPHNMRWDRDRGDFFLMTGMRGCPYAPTGIFWACQESHGSPSKAAENLK